MGLKPQPGTRKAWRWAMFAIIGFLAVTMASCLLILVLILHPVSPPVVHIESTAAQQLRHDFEAAQKTAATGAPGVVQADETEVNSLVREYFQDYKKSPDVNDAAVVRDMKLKLLGDHVRLYVAANFHGKDLTFVLEGKVHSVDGYLNFEPISGKIGSLPLPRASLRKATAEMLASPEGRESLRLPNNLRELRIDDGKLIVVFK
jgi:uncharacterized protein YpmS